MKKEKRKILNLFFYKIYIVSINLIRYTQYDGCARVNGLFTCEHVTYIYVYVFIYHIIYKMKLFNYVMYVYITYMYIIYI